MRREMNNCVKKPVRQMQIFSPLQDRDEIQSCYLSQIYRPPPCLGPEIREANALSFMISWVSHLPYLSSPLCSLVVNMSTPAEKC